MKDFVVLNSAIYENGSSHCGRGVCRSYKPVNLSGKSYLPFHVVGPTLSFKTHGSKLDHASA